MRYSIVNYPTISKPGDVDGELGSLRLVINEGYPGRWTCVTNNYDGPGSMLGSGRSAAQAAADFAEQYADSEVVNVLAEAWEAINVLGGTDGGPFNEAIGAALAIVERLGAPQGRRK